MRAQAQRSSAANRDGSAGRGSAFGRIFAATRAPSAGKGGSAAPSHRPSRLAIGMLAVALVLLALAPSAQASVTTRSAIASFGPDGTAATSFGVGNGDVYTLAFDQAADRLYVLDKSGPKIHAFATPSLTPVGGNFPLAVPAHNCCTMHIAVDNSGGASQGRLYYVAGDNKIYAYGPTGTPVGGAFPLTVAGVTGLQVGAAVDASGNLFVSNLQGRVIRKFSPAGALLATIPAVQSGHGPRPIAIDSNGDLFVDQANVGVYRYTAPAYTTATQVLGGTSSVSLGLDRTTHRLYITLFDGSVSVYDSLTNAFLYSVSPSVPGESLRTVAVDESTDTLYAGDSASSSAGEARRIFVFGPAQSFADATARPTAATSISDESAEIGAEITDNNALPTNWRLELSADDGSTWSTLRTGQTAGGQIDAPVSATATDLNPNFNYRFRVVTNKGTRPETEVISAPMGFRTIAPPPVITDVGAIQVADTSARLVATIDPRNTPTDYVFEYGTTPALGSTTSPLNIGSGIREITVSQVVGGLAKDSDYYFRAVATNPSGSTPSVQRTLHTRTDPLPLPDNRGYEMVSPPDKGLGGVNQGGRAGVEVALDGESVGYCTFAFFGDPTGQAPESCAPYTGRRTPGGWQSVSPYPYVCHFDLGGGSLKADLGILVSDDFNRAVLQVPESPACVIPPLDPAAPLEAGQTMNNLYLQDIGGNPLDYELLTQQSTLPQVNGPPIIGGGSDDLSRVVYRSPTNQSSPPDSPAPGNFWKVYEWHNGSSTLVSKSPSNVPYATTSTLPAPWRGGGWLPQFSPVSSDGKRVFFNNLFNTPPSPSETRNADSGRCGPPQCELYMRENVDQPPSPQALGSAVGSGDLTAASPTVSNLSVAEGAFAVGQKLSGAGIPGNTTVAACTPDCTSPTGLTLSQPASVGGSGVALEAYSECTDDALACTFHVSASECTVDCGINQADQFEWATGNGEKAFFASCGRLTDASAPTVNCNNLLEVASTSGVKLYRWDRGGSPGARLVDLTVDREPADGTQPRFKGLVGAGEDGNTAYFFADGQIVAGAPLTTGLKIYRWTWNGGSPVVDYLGSFDVPAGGRENQENYADFQFNRRVTPDGRYMLLTTETRLVPFADRDSDYDVYRWGEAEGWACVSCQLPGVDSTGDAGLGSGGSGKGSGMIPRFPISDDGSRVFFETTDALLPADTNGEAGCPDLSVPAFPVGFACTDVYEWHDGALHLISTGTGEQPARLTTATPSGDDVFFTTRNRLVGWDTDNGNDLYVAREGGGFPEPPPTPVPCEGEACRGAASAPSSVPGAGTRPFVAPVTGPRPNDTCGRFNKKAQRKRGAARKAARKGQAKRARALRKQARNLNRRAKRCNRRNAS